MPSLLGTSPAHLLRSLVIVQECVGLIHDWLRLRVGGFADVAWRRGGSVEVPVVCWRAALLHQQRSNSYSHRGVPFRARFGVIDFPRAAPPCILPTPPAPEVSSFSVDARCCTTPVVTHKPKPGARAMTWIIHNTACPLRSGKAPRWQGLPETLPPGRRAVIQLGRKAHSKGPDVEVSPWRSRMVQSFQRASTLYSRPPR